MSDALFDRIVDQLSRIPLGKICTYLENEPLLDPDIFNRIRLIKDRLNFTSLEFSTNAQDLDDKAVAQLADLFSDVKHEIWVSFHGVDKRTHEGVMGLDYERCLENIVGLLQLSDRKPLCVIIRGAGQGIDRSLRHDFEFSEEEYTRFWEDQLQRHGIKTRPGINWIRYHDRAGGIQRNEIRQPQPVRQDLTGLACPRVSQWLHFLYTGELIACCMDYHRETVFGNIAEGDIEDILGGPAYKVLSKKATGLASSPADFICKRCISPGG